MRRLAAQAGRFPTLDIAPLDSAGLEGREQALAYAIHDAVLRRWLTLEAVLNGFLKRPLRAAEPPAQAALLAGAAQILLLDRIPEHAAIDESVRWVKRVGRHSVAAGGSTRRRASGHPGGLVNGVLRSLTRGLERGADGAIARREVFSGRRDEIPLGDGSAVGFNTPLLPEDEAARLSAHASITPWLIRRWLAEDPRRARQRALHSLLHAPVTLNIAHTGALESQFIQPHERAGSAIFTGPRSELEFLLRGRSDLWVQDAASAAPLGKLQMANGQMANPAAGAGAGSVAPSDLPFANLPFAISTIADLCAGAGTKTRQLAAIFPDAEIIASDPDEARAATLRSVFANSPTVRVLDPAEARENLIASGGADLILLDVPCSNTGVLGRRPEARYRASQAQLDRLAAIQRQIIADAIPLLKPGGGARGGAILYSTCSLEPEENEQQAAWARKWHKCDVGNPLRLEPTGHPGATPTPHTYTDAAFAVLLTNFGG